MEVLFCAYCHVGKGIVIPFVEYFIVGYEFVFGIDGCLDVVADFDDAHSQGEGTSVGVGGRDLTGAILLEGCGELGLQGLVFVALDTFRLEGSVEFLLCGAVVGIGVKV